MKKTTKTTRRKSDADDVNVMAFDIVRELTAERPTKAPRQKPAKSRKASVAKSQKSS